MSTKKINAGDTLTAGDLTDDYLGAVIEVGPVSEITYRLRLDRIKHGDADIVTMWTAAGGIYCAYRQEPVTVITPPPVVQPDEPTEIGQCIRIEGDDKWRAVRIDGVDVIAPFCDADGKWWGWDEILDEIAKGRQVIVSDPPRWPNETPVVPERIEVGEWPDDDTHLRDWTWVDIDGDGYCWRWATQVGGWTRPGIDRNGGCAKPFDGPWIRWVQAR